MTLELMQRELANLKKQYVYELADLGEHVAETQAKAERDRFSDHDPFNMSANCQNLARLAGKIEQTANVVRWMEAQ